MNYSTQTRAWVDFDGNKSIFDAAGNIQFGEVFGGTSNFGQITNRPDPDLVRGYNWEYSASVQHQLMARVSVTAGYYRRNFYNLDVTDNLNLATTEWNPFGITTPTDPRLPLSGEPITMYSLNANKVGVATDNLRRSRTSTPPSTTASNSAPTRGQQAAAVRRRHDRSAACDGHHRATSATTRTASGSATRRRRSAPRYKLSAAYQLPWDFQLSGTSIATPGPSVNANYTVTAAIAGRPIIGSTAGATTISVNLASRTRCSSTTRSSSTCASRRTSASARSRIQGFADIFNLLNAGTVLRVNETYGANPATNAWLTPTAIMDGRYVRFGMQMSFRATAHGHELGAVPDDRLVYANFRRSSRCWPSSPTSCPTGDGFLFEPKWDGFRAIVFRGGDDVYIQSRDLQAARPLLPRAARRAAATRCPTAACVDGEIVIADAARPRLRRAAAAPPPGGVAGREAGRGDAGVVRRLRPARASTARTCATRRSASAARGSSGCSRGVDAADPPHADDARSRARRRLARRASRAPASTA